MQIWNKDLKNRLAVKLKGVVKWVYLGGYMQVVLY